MNRRSACACLLAAFKTTVLSSVVMATEGVARTVQRIAGPRWNVNGDWNPSVEALQRHLLAAHGIDPAGLGMDEMLALHDNDHNRRASIPGQGGKPGSKGHSKGYRKA